MLVSDFQQRFVILGQMGYSLTWLKNILVMNKNIYNANDNNNVDFDPLFSTDNYIFNINRAYFYGQINSFS
jgi:hypothetical protein